MTEKTLYQKLSNILETIDAEKYTDIVSIIDCNIEDDGTVYMDAFDFACDLHNADGAEILPKKVADLLIEIYLEEIENEKSEEDATTEKCSAETKENDVLETEANSEKIEKEESVDSESKA